MTHDWLTLGDGDAVEWAGHPKLTTVLPAVVVGLLVVAGSVAAAASRGSVFPLLLVPVGLLLPAVRYLQVRNTEYVVTTREVAVKKGVVGRSVTRASLDRVQNSAYEQGIAGSLFGYGTVTIETAGGQDLRFHRIERPGEVRRLVDRVAGKTGGVPGSPDQWTAVLAEVRQLREAVESR